MKQPSYSTKQLIDSEKKKQSHPVWGFRMLRPKQRLKQSPRAWFAFRNAAPQGDEKLVASIGHDFMFLVDMEMASPTPH
jgi:hypothetical protein